jgi:hypothetical protein
MNATQPDVRLHHQHYANLLAHLARRMDTARQHNDSRLLALLEQEQQQLAAEWSSTQRAIAPSIPLVQQFWHWLVQSIKDSSQLHVEKITSTDGNTWWHAYDPRTGKALYAESESEVVKWIEEHHLG